MHTVKPIDKVVRKAADKNKLIVTVEEHNVVGGLSSAVSEYLSSFKNNSSQLAIGIKDFFPNLVIILYAKAMRFDTKSDCSEYYIFIKIINNFGESDMFNFDQPKLKFGVAYTRRDTWMNKETDSNKNDILKRFQFWEVSKYSDFFH